MKGAQVLAIGGTTSSLSVMLGGWLKIPLLVGMAGFIMLLANLLTLIVERKVSNDD